jgi:hypothetical protein
MLSLPSRQSLYHVVGSRYVSCLSLPNIKVRTVSAQFFVRPDRWDPLVSGSVGRRRGRRWWRCEEYKGRRLKIPPLRRRVREGEDTARTKRMPPVGRDGGRRAPSPVPAARSSPEEEAGMAPARAATHPPHRRELHKPPVEKSNVELGPGGERRCGGRAPRQRGHASRHLQWRCGPHPQQRWLRSQERCTRASAR